MNPLLSNSMKPISSMGGFLGNSPIGNIMRFMNEYKRLKANPSELGEFLYKQGKIDKTQLSEIQRFNGDPTKIGEYLINCGSIPKNQLGSLQNDTTQFQQYLNSQNAQNSQNFPNQ